MSRFDGRLCASAVVLFSAAFSMGAPAVAAVTNLPIYEVASASPPVDHVIGPVRVRECRRDATPEHLEEARSAALARLSDKASSKGANGILHLEVKVTESNSPVLAKGMRNPCLFETVVRGDAAVLSGPGRPAPQLAASQQ